MTKYKLMIVVELKNFVFLLRYEYEAQIIVYQYPKVLFSSLPHDRELKVLTNSPFITLFMWNIKKYWWQQISECRYPGIKIHL